MLVARAYVQMALSFLGIWRHDTTNRKMLAGITGVVGVVVFVFVGIGLSVGLGVDAASQAEECSTPRFLTGVARNERDFVLACIQC